MVIASFLLSLLILIAIIGGGVYAAKRARSSFGELISVYNSFVSKKDDQTPSALEEFIQGSLQTAIDSYVTSASARSMANKSHIARQTNLIAEDMLQDQATADNPLLGMFLAQYPSIRKRLAKNPSAIQAVMPLLGKLSISPSGSGVVGDRSNGKSNIAARIRNDR